MKQTLTINLNGIVFHIDSDAYNLLQDYLQKVEQNLSGDDAKDVLQDIEARIAELFTQMLQRASVQVVSQTTVEIVMQQLGSPEAFASDDEPTPQDEKQEKHATHKYKHLYRDTRNQLLGGVCAGLGAYFNVDAVWVRLLFTLLIVFYGAPIFVYLLLWLIVPEAKTTAQRLEMRGEEPSVGNIEKEVQRQKQEGEDTPHEGCLYHGFSFALKLFIGLCILCIVPVVLLGIFVIGVCIVASFGALVGVVPDIATELPFITEAMGISTAHALAFIICTLLLILIPIIMLTYWLVKHFRKHEPVPARFWWITGVIWVLSLIGCGTTVVYAAPWNNSAMHELIDDDFANLPETVIPNLASFSGVTATGGIEVILQQGEKQEVTLRTNCAECIVTEVNNGVLELHARPKNKRNFKALFTITTPNITRLQATGASEIEGRGLIVTDDIKIGASGSSDIDLQLQAKNVTCSASGASDIDLRVQAQRIVCDASGASDVDLKGTATALDIKVSGASNIDADELQVSDVIVDCSGASEADVFATKSAKLEASGASSIEYKGNPTILSEKSTGASSIRPKH